MTIPAHVLEGLGVLAQAWADGNAGDPGPEPDDREGRRIQASVALATAWIGLQEPGPLWVPCECGEHWCRLHGLHAFECDCPPLEDLEASPY